MDQTQIPAALGRKGELCLSLAGGGIRMEFRNGNAAPEVHSSGELPGKYNYFVGSDARRWLRGIPAYARVEFRNLYRGINLVYYGRESRLEYDWVIGAGADPSAIRLAFSGASRTEISSNGELIAGTGAGQVRHLAPRAYQEVNGRRRVITAAYVRRGSDEFGFALGPYDRKRSLIIDPVLAYSITMGGNPVQFPGHEFEVDSGAAMALDPAGDVYLAGTLFSRNFPPIGPAPSSAASFVMKLDPSGATVLYGTYFSALPAGIAVDPAGNAYVTGTAHTALPVTPGAAQSSYGGPVAGAFTGDAFAAKFDPSGNLVYATYIGGSRRDVGTAVAVDAAGNAYVTGETSSDDFPTVNALQGQRQGTTCLTYATVSDCPDAFVTMVNPQGTAFVYSTYLGGTDYDGAVGIAVDIGGNAYITGRTNSADFPVTDGALQNQFAGGVCDTLYNGDAFIAKLAAAGQSLVYATFLGGHGCELPSGIAVDAAGAAYIIGSTESLDFPTTPGSFQPSFGGYGSCLDIIQGHAFVAKIDPSASGLAYATYLGGSACDSGTAIAVDTAGNAYLTGRTASVDFPLFLPVQPGTAGGGACNTGGFPPPDTPCYDAFVTVLSPAGDVLRQSTFLGNTSLDQGTAIGVDASGNAYVMGLTLSPDFPVVGPQLQAGGSIFVTKISPSGVPPSFSANSITDESGAASGLIAGANAVISGTNLTTATGNVEASSPPPTDLAGTSVMINRTAVPILSLTVSGNSQQITIQVPAALPAGVATVSVNNNGNVAVVTGVPAGIQIRRIGDGQAGTAEHRLPLPLSLAPAGNNVYWQATGGGEITTGANGATWTLGRILGQQTAIAAIGSDNPPVSIQFTATATAGSVPVPAIAGILNGAGFDKSPRALSPGMIASVFGTNLSEAPAAGIVAKFELPRILAGSEVTFDGLPAPFFFASPTQLNVQVPYELANYPSARVVVTVAGVASLPVTVPLAPASPGIFTVNSQDPNLAAALNQDNSINSAAQPAAAGSVVQVFATGLGLFRTYFPSLPPARFSTGDPAYSFGDLVWTASTPVVTIGSVAAPVLFSGLAPGFVGLWQVNIQVPQGVPSGEVPLLLSISGQAANPVTIFVK